MLFTDDDSSFDAIQGLGLLAAIVDGTDLASGSRVLGRRQRGTLSVPQIAGNRVAGLLSRLLWGAQ